MRIPPPAADAPLRAAVCIGRFQPFHSGHLALLQRALSSAPTCIVVLGSSFQARTPKNPFTWHERAEMIRLSLSEQDRNRVQFLPLRDWYDEERWTAAVRQGVERLSPQTNNAGAIGLFGHFKDATSEYLRNFPGWRMKSLERLHAADATALRDAYFSSPREAMTGTLAALVDQVPAPVRDFLQAWSALPAFEEMRVEWEMLRTYKASWAASPYPPVFVTADVVLTCSDHVLLIRRAKAPGKGLLAMPGGFIDPRETAYQAALRELHEETGVSLLPQTMRQALRTARPFDHPDRGQRGRTFTHAHHFDLGERELPEVVAGDDAASASWVPIKGLSALEDQFMDDHFHILDELLGLTVADAQ
jgi:bifunctional NMN adenylyltransferase/nudix hydrolase